MACDGTKRVSKKRVYISLPKKYIAALTEHYELEHGLIVKDLNPYLNEGYVRAYFSDYGTITSCKINKSPNPGKDKSVAFVRFSTEDEADRADWDGPHYIAGTEVKLRRFVSPKTEEDSEEEVATAPVKARPRPSKGLGYILEDAQWLDDDMD